MGRLGLFLPYALNGLKRGGQRVIIAILAVAFGVMSLIAMADIANAIERTLSDDPRISLGGDLRLTSATDLSLDTLADLQEEGIISAYSPVERTAFLLMRTSDSGRSYFVQSGESIDPETYPLVGEIVISEPQNASLIDLLQNTGDALITRDMAARYNINIGDDLRLAQFDGTALSIPITVRAIVSDTPNHTGGRLYYNQATSAQLLGNDVPTQNYITALTENTTIASERLQALGWQVETVNPNAISAAEGSELFDFMLRGAGILGLIVGGIGIANTMNVLLAQRQQEVGILKTLGYSQRDMMLIFMLEAGLIGLIGSLIGVLLASLLSQGLIGLFANISTLLVTWQPDALLILSSLLTGILTTIIFAFYAIFRTSRIRPTVIFRRNQSQNRSWRDALATLAFYALLSIPFAGVTSLFLGSVIEGAGIVLFAIAGFIVLGIVFSIIMWLILRFLPTLRLNLLRLARISLRKRASSMLFAMIALFVGIFTMGFALTIIQVGSDQFTVRQFTDDSVANVLVYADETLVPQVTDFIRTQVDNPNIQYRYIASVADQRVNEQSIGSIVHIRDSAWDIEIVDGADYGSENGVYVPESSALTLGDTVSITLSDGSENTLPIIGRYTRTDALLISTILSPVMSQQTAASLGIDSGRINVYATVPLNREAAIAQAIGQQFPQTMILTRGDVSEQVNGLFLNLLGFALAMSGLALLAGVMLIANVVSLAMLQRTFEIGVMKALGYTQRHVMILFSLEYSLIGLLAGLLALLAVQIIIVIITSTQSGADGILFIRPLTACIMVVSGMLLTMTTALLTAWRPLRVRPALVLNEPAT